MPFLTGITNSGLQFFRTALGAATRVLFMGGYTGSARSDVIDYVTAETTGNATDFGDLTVGRNGLVSGASSTRALAAGGYNAGRLNIIDYVTIATTGNALDFGDMTQSGTGPAAASNETRMVLGGLDITAAYFTYSSRIEYVTIA